MTETSYGPESAEEIDRRIAKIQRGVALDFANLPPGHPDTFDLAPGGTRVNILCLRANQAALVRLLEASGAFTWEEYARVVMDELDIAVMQLEKRLGDRIGKGVEIL